MATTVVSAVLELYNSISAAHFGGTRPPIWLNQAPKTDTAGSQLRPPYVILYDDGLRPEFDSSLGGIERGELRIEVYANKVEATGEITVNSITNGILYGGGNPNAKLGLDFGALPLTGFKYRINLMRTYDRTRYAGFDDKDVQRVHVRELRYAVIVGLKPA
jgi:hypothetical protein